MSARVWLSIRDLENRGGLGERSNIYRKYKRGEFPEPKYLGNRRVWLLSDIEQWEAEQLARPEGARRGAKNLTPSARMNPDGTWVRVPKDGSR